MVGVRIRGIYSTALTKLLLDHGFEIVQPSKVIKGRFGFPDSEETETQPSLKVHSRIDRQGVIISGDEASLEKVIHVLMLSLDDVVFRNLLERPLWVDSWGSMRLENSTRPLSLKGIEGGLLHRLDIEFPGLSKMRLDEIRASVTPTVTGHHYYKACGGRISLLVDIAEKMLGEGCPRGEVESLLQENVWSMLPREGSRINISHIKIWGQKFNLGPAEVMRFQRRNGKLILLRRFFKKGIYDGLQVSKDEGDFAVSEFKIGDLSFRTRYFSRYSSYKGTYVNINTPIEIYPSEIRYVDLEVDICIWPDGKIKTIEYEKLEKAMSLGLVSERIVQISKSEVKRILDSISLEKERDAYNLIQTD